MTPHDRSGVELFAAAVRMIRLQRRLTMRNLASAAQLSPSYLCLIENGSRTPPEDVKLRLARALGVDARTMTFAPKIAARIIDAITVDDARDRLSEISKVLEEVEAEIAALRRESRRQGA